MTSNTILTIGYYHFNLPVQDAIKVVEMLSKAQMVDDSYDHDYKRRGDGFRGTYWHLKDDEEITIRVEIVRQSIEPARREPLP
jgi:hypothetical protein